MTATVEVHLRRRFQCSVCSKAWSSRGQAERHIRDGCIHDPEAHACATCTYDYRGDQDHGPSCGMEVRPDDVVVVRHCPSWEISRWPR